MNPRVFIWGMGNLGLGLALALQRCGIPLVGAFNRGAKRAAKARSLLGIDVPSGDSPSPALVQQATVIIVAVSDDAIAAVGRQLAALPRHGGAVLAHTSGCLPASELGPQSNASCGSLHPLLACATPEQASTSLPDSLFTIEGEAAACAALETIVARLGGRTCRLDASAKARYHAAAVLASNLMIALLDVAVGEAEAAGLNDASGALSAFARQAVDNACQLGPLQALTGPALRGDARTLQRHAECLGEQALPIYQLLSGHAVDMAGKRGLDAATQAVLRHLLSSGEFASRD